MSYSHYWYQPPTLDCVRWQKFIADVKKIKLHIHKYYGIKVSNPLFNVSMKSADRGSSINDEFMALNGLGDHGHDALIIEAKGAEYINFCNTERKPYDIAVVMVLIALKHHFPEIVVDSDGTAEELMPARAAMQKILKYGLKTIIE